MNYFYLWKNVTHSEVMEISTKYQRNKVFSLQYGICEYVSILHSKPFWILCSLMNCLTRRCGMKVSQNMRKFR